MKNFGYLLLLFTIISLNRCSEADAKESKTRSDAFDKIDKIYRIAQNMKLMSN